MCGAFVRYFRIFLYFETAPCAPLSKRKAPAERGRAGALQAGDGPRETTATPSDADAQITKYEDGQAMWDRAWRVLEAALTQLNSRRRPATWFAVRRCLNRAADELAT